MLILASFSSCYPQRQIVKEGPKSIWIKSNLPLYYQNLNSRDTSQELSLWNKLNMSRKYISKKYDKNAIVELRRINERNITFYLHENFKIIDSLNLRGRIYKDYFSVKRKVVHIGIPMVFYFYYESKILIGFSRDETFLLKSALSRFGNIFILTAGNTEVGCLKYKKK